LGGKRGGGKWICKNSKSKKLRGDSSRATVQWGRETMKNLGEGLLAGRLRSTGGQGVKKSKVPRKNSGNTPQPRWGG